MAESLILSGVIVGLFGMYAHAASRHRFGAVVPLLVAVALLGTGLVMLGVFA